jgi:HK97 family phage prohead protease
MASTIPISCVAVAPCYGNDADYPVTRTLRISVVNGCLTALTQFPPEGTSEKSDECYRLIREGVVNSTSLGFIPVEWEFLDKNRPGSSVLFREVQMLEFSFVSIPANPSALIIAKSPGPTGSPATPPENSPIHYAGTLAQRQAQVEYSAESVERRRRIARALALRAGWY